MSFRVQKSLGNSLFQFAVARRREFRSIDEDPEMSTGPAGEFIRHRPEIHYQADLRAIRTPEVPPARSVSGTPFWTSLVDGTPRGWVNLALIIIGGLFILFGLAIVANRGPQGWIVVILGLIMAGFPIAVLAQKRSVIRRQEEKIRRDREERDTRNRELLAAYTTALEHLREDPSDANLAVVLRENEKLDLPYAVWADTAIGTVLYVGFSSLARLGPERAGDVAALMDRASEAAGLIAEDAKAVKNAIYSTILWHFLADDRLGRKQLEIVRSVQEGFGISNDDVPHDAAAESQFERLRGIDHRNAPRCTTEIPLGMNEYCMYTAEVRLSDAATSPIYITNRRFIMEGARKVEIPVPEIDDVIVDADRFSITVRASELKRPVEFLAGEPIYLAAMLDLATRLDQRPKSFA
jgi:hypothetical protein